jgi:hypothetical protein
VFFGARGELPVLLSLSPSHPPAFMVATTAAMYSTLASFLAVLIFAAMTVGQPAPPNEGYQLSDSPLFEIIMPLSVAQCEPVLIYYDITKKPDVYLLLFTPDFDILASFKFPGLIGYLEWICNIPSGIEFVAASNFAYQLYKVQPGSSTDCLGNVTTTYSAVEYATAAFQTYTEFPMPSTTIPEPQAQACVCLANILLILAKRLLDPRSLIL